MLVTGPGASGSCDEYVKNILQPIPTICQSLQEWGEEPAFLFMCWVIWVPSCTLFRHRPEPTFSFISVEETDVQVCGMSEVTRIFRGRTQTQCKPPKAGPWFNVGTCVYTHARHGEGNQVVPSGVSAASEGH